MDPPNPIRPHNIVPSAVTEHSTRLDPHPFHPTTSSQHTESDTNRTANNETDVPSYEATIDALSSFNAFSTIPCDPLSNVGDHRKLSESIMMCFSDWHGKTARQWQIEACEEVLWRHLHRPSSALLRPLLLVRSTGGGKSAVRDVSGFLCGGITLTIVPLLSLSADQTAKLSQLASDQQLTGRLHIFNLDVLRSKSLNDTLRSNLENLSYKSATRVSLFSSPQKLTNDPLWQQTICTCFRNGTLRLIAIDECHLYASHGVEFRSEFSDLKKVLFPVANRRIIKEPVPVLFMTATASSLMLHDLESLTGLSFHPTDDLVWPRHHSGVQRRNIFLDLTFQDSPLRRIKRDVVKTCHASGGRKVMVYSNSRKAITHLYEQTRSHLNMLGIQKDLLLVHGLMFREQKFHNTELFVGKPLVEECPSSKRILRFDPVAYFATAGTSSSGVDCHEVDRVLFHGFPQSIEDLLQCSGQCGRGPDATAHNSSFCLIVSLNSLVSLLTRIFILPKYATEQNTKQPPSSEATNSLFSPEALAIRQWYNVRRILAILCLDDGQCVHYRLEREMLHPHSEAVCDLPTHCAGACWRCRTLRIATPFDALINIQQLKRYLIMMFITQKLPPSQLLLHKDVFLDAVIGFETVNAEGASTRVFPKSVFGVITKHVIKQRTKALILKCFCAGILESEVDGSKLLAKLGYCSNGNPRLNDPMIWQGFKELDPSV